MCIYKIFLVEKSYLMSIINFISDYIRKHYNIILCLFFRKYCLMTIYNLGKLIFLNSIIKLL